ncbi:MAG: hypothetical protein ACK4NS_00670 [Saprospiraceae bacterium]
MQNRTLILAFAAFFCACGIARAQPVGWITPCSDTTFCLNFNSCQEANVLLTERAYTNCQNGTNMSYLYRVDLFNNGGIDLQAPKDTFSAKLPPGTHKIIWRANDNCGAVVQCSYLITVKDCQPPHLVCINGITRNLDEVNCNAKVWSSQFVLNLSDNCIAPSQIQIGMRKKGEGSGFPDQDTVHYELCDQGFNLIEVWAKDNNGLTTSCNGYVLVQKSGSECECKTSANLSLSGCVKSPSGSPITPYRSAVRVQSVAGVNTPYAHQATQNQNAPCFEMQVKNMPLGGTYQAYLNIEKYGPIIEGVTTFDLVTINKHILGQQPLTNVYQALAADANSSGTITTFDIVEIRKAILGISDTFANAPSWRFVHPIADTSDLLGFKNAIDTSEVSFTLDDDLSLSGFEWVGVKIGDVNMSAFSAPDDAADDGSGYLPIPLPDRLLQPGEILDLPLPLPRDPAPDGWQWAIELAPESLTLLASNIDPDCSRYDLHTGVLRALHYESAPLEPLIRIQARQPIRLSEAIRLRPDLLAPEIYFSGKKWGMGLEFRDTDGGRGAAITFFPE